MYLTLFKLYPVTKVQKFLRKNNNKIRQEDINHQTKMAAAAAAEINSDPLSASLYFPSAFKVNKPVSFIPVCIKH